MWLLHCIECIVFQALLNEKFSPELLEHKADIVECMMEQLQQMEENIQKARKSDFKVSLHRLEVGIGTG